MALVFMDRQGEEIYPYHRRMSLAPEQGADDSAGSYSGRSLLAHLSLHGYSICLLINTVLSLSLLIMVVSPFLIPYLGLCEGHPPRSLRRKERRKGGKEVQRH
jgi:hypothetical protein